MKQQDSSFLLGSKTADKACLLIHGFSGTPNEMYTLGKTLASNNMRVVGVSLAGHNGNPEELLHSKRRQWLRSAEIAFEQLDHYPHIFLVGFSMGGVIALLLGIKHPERIAGIITLSTPTRFTGGWQVQLVPVAKYFMQWFYPLENLDFTNPKVQQEVLLQARLRDPDVQIDFSNVQTVEALKKMVKLPIPAIAELFALTNQCRKQLKKLHVPLLIIQSRKDQTVDPHCAEELDRLTPKAFPKYMRWLERSDHMIMNGSEKKVIDQAIQEFIDRLIPGV